MAIKAIEVVTHNHGDGRLLDVEWQERFEPIKEWYFYTNRSTIWRVSRNDWMAEGLVDFTFNDIPQDIDRFRNASYWKERFGDLDFDKNKFTWTLFYEELADKLIACKDKRQELCYFINQIANKFDLSYLKEKKLSDICPFTVLELLEKGKAYCRFDELTVDTVRNRYVLSALECLLKLNIKASLARRCRALILSLERLGVSKVKPINYNMKSERFGRHDVADQKMLAAAQLAFSLALPTETRSKRVASTCRKADQLASIR